MTRIFLGIAFASLSVVACGSDDSTGSGGGATSATSAAATNGAGGMTSSTTGGPSSTVGNGPASTGAGGSGPGSGGMGGSTGMGACTNAADMAILNSKDVEGIVGKCGNDNLGAEPATKDCIKSMTGLSDPCVGCFDATIQCAVQSCLTQCLGNQMSPECQMCLDQNCVPAFNTCSGLMM